METFAFKLSSRRTHIFVGIALLVSIVVIVIMSERDTLRSDSISDTEMRFVAERQPLKWQIENMDNSPAVAYLVDYARQFQPRDVQVPVQPDPDRPETITTWWQAAAMVDWYMGAPVRYTCKNKVSMGNWFICQDEPYTIKPPCLVYSFGIGWDFTFDDEMAKLGCEVHSFDPSMKEKDHKRGNSTFHNMGIGSYNTDAFVPRQDEYVKDSQIWKVRTLKSLMKELGHEKRVIDVLKMDVESYEWSIIDNMMETDVFQFVRQFDVEYHLFHDYPLRQEYVNIYQIYTMLRGNGFVEYLSDHHQRVTDTIETLRLQADVCYINVFFDRRKLGR